MESIKTTFASCLSCARVNRVRVFSDDENKTPVCGHCGFKFHLRYASTESSGVGLKNLIEKSSSPVIVDFWAPWSGPCRVFAPIFEKASKDFIGDVVFTRLNSEEFPKAGELYSVRSVPTLVLFKGGIEKVRMSGSMPYDAFVGWIRGVQSM